MANVKFIAVSRGLRGIVDYVTNREKTVEQLISGVNCVARTAVPEFETGVKFHQSAREMQQVKDYCGQLCREYGLPVSCITAASCCRSWWSGISPAVKNGKITRKNMSSITVSA